MRAVPIGLGEQWRIYSRLSSDMEAGSNPNTAHLLKHTQGPGHRRQRNMELPLYPCQQSLVFSRPDSEGKRWGMEVICLHGRVVVVRRAKGVWDERRGELVAKRSCRLCCLVDR